jgi:hypothetical protein
MRPRLAGLAFMGLVVSARSPSADRERPQLRLRRDIPGGACA